MHNFSLVKRTLAVGADTYKLEVTVKNKGDDAYNAKLYVTIPKGIKIGRIFTLRDTEGEDVSIVKVQQLCLFALACSNAIIIFGFSSLLLLLLSEGKN